MTEVRRITVEDRVGIHGHRELRTLSVRWACLICGKPRGTPRTTGYGVVLSWNNSCGHIETIDMVLGEDARQRTAHILRHRESMVGA